MLVLDSSDHLLLDPGDRFAVGAFDNDGAADGTGVLGLFWSRAVGGSAPERVTCPVEELEPPKAAFSAETTTLAVIVRGSAPGAVRLAADDLDHGGIRAAETDIDDAGEIAVPLERGRTEYRLRAAVYNSRGAGVAHLYRVNEATNETELAHYITVYEVILNTNFSHRDPRYISGFRYTDGDDGIVKDKQSLISYGPKYKEYVTQYNGDDAKIDYWYSILPPPLR